MSEEAMDLLFERAEATSRLSLSWGEEGKALSRSVFPWRRERGRLLINQSAILAAIGLCISGLAVLSRQVK